MTQGIKAYIIITSMVVATLSAMVYVQSGKIAQLKADLAAEVYDAEVMKDLWQRELKQNEDMARVVMACQESLRAKIDGNESGSKTSR
jgi:sorbitol-specific phosphotransferase system component IIBC